MLNIPTEFGFTADKAELTEVMKYNADISLKDDLRPVVLNLENGKLTSWFINRRYKSVDDIEVSKVDGNVTIGLNVGYMLDALKLIDENKVTVDGKDARSPITIKNDDYGFLILPVNINNSTVVDEIRKANVA